MKKITIILFPILALSYGCGPSTESSEEFSYAPYTFEYADSTYTADSIGTASSNNAVVASALRSLPSCVKPPTQTEVNNGEWTYTDHFWSRSEALKMGIPIVNTSASHSLKIYVRDYRRVAPCTGSNSVTVYYGQVIRAVIEIENYDAQIGVDLASIAASGTLQKTTQHFYFYKTGFYNPKIDQILSSVSGKVFDVENYSLYQGVMKDVIALLADTATTFSPNYVGVDMPLETDDEILIKAPIITYSLSSIAKGNTCNETKKKFKDDKFALDVVQSTYKSVECPIGDEKPTERAKLNATEYLQGVKVKN